MVTYTYGSSDDSLKIETNTGADRHSYQGLDEAIEHSDFAINDVTIVFAPDGYASIRFKHYSDGGYYEYKVRHANGTSLWEDLGIYF